MSDALVSVIICVYNAGDYLRSSLMSILSQTHENLEALVIDDGSTDGCMESIRDIDDPRVRVLRQENAGKPTALNRGLEESRGEYIAIHDADDISAPRRLELQAGCLADNPELAAVMSGYEFIIDDKHVAPTTTALDEEECRSMIERFRMPAHDPTVMFRARHIEGLRFEPSLELGEGKDFILQVGEKHPIVVLGESLYGYRIHTGSLTQTRIDKTAHFEAEVVRRACERRGIEPPQKTIEAFYKKRGRSSRKLVSHFMESVANQKTAGRFWNSLKTSLQSIQLQPLSLYHYRPLLYSLAPRGIIQKYRAMRGR